MFLFGPIGLFLVLSYAWQGEPPWLVPLFYTSLVAPVVGIGLLVAGVIVPRQKQFRQ
jgi:hypothetical protein